MNILLLSPWFPLPPFGGARIRVHETLRHLSRRHRVTLLAPVGRHQEPVAPEAVASLCERVVAVPVSDAAPSVLRRMAAGLLRGMPLIQSLHRDRAMAQQVRRLTDRQDFDVIHVEHSFMTPYLSDVSPASRARTVLSMHNIESLRFRRELRTLRWGARRVALLSDRILFGSWEERAVRRYDGIAAVSGMEEAWIREHAPAAHITLVPNGVDCRYFSPSPPVASARTILFTGLMNYPPNVDAVLWFCDEVLPLVLARHPRARFLIVGDKPGREVLALRRRPQVEVAGRVADVRPYLAECAAVVVPVRSGAGTRLKILEAMAAARPVVSTGLGAEGLRTTDGVDIRIANTAPAMAAQVSELLADPEQRSRIGWAGRALVEKLYDWSTCFQNLDALYEAVTRPAYSPSLDQVQDVAS